MMLAIAITRYGGPEVLEAVDLPTPVPAAGETLVRIRAIGVNPADAKWRAGMFASFVPLTFPHVPGYDIAGEVIGGGGFPVGTRVFGMLDPIAKGGYARMVAVPDAHLAVMPDGIDFTRAAAIPTAGLTGMQIVEAALDVQPGARVLVTGAVGAVGRFAVHAVKARGATVIAAVRRRQFEAAVAVGADEMVDIAAPSGGMARFDAVVDTIGGAIVAPWCRHLTPGGRIVSAATTPIPSEGLRVQPESFAVRPDGSQLARLGATVAAGWINVPIARTLPLDQAREAHAALERGGLGGKIILLP